MIKKQVRNFINTGDYRGEKGNIYRRDKPERRNDLHDSMDDVKRWQGDEAANDYGNINHSLRGKIGRAAGVMGARGYLGYQNLKNKFRRK